MVIDRLTHPDQLDDPARRALVGCWVAVTDAGGAVGFPFPPRRRRRCRSGSPPTTCATRY